MHEWDVDAIERGFRSFLNRVDRAAPSVQRGDIARQLPSFSVPVPLKELVDLVDRLLLEGNLHTTHPRYFGLFNPSVRLSSVLGDLMVATANPQVGAWFHSPVATEIESHVLHFFAEKFGMPDAAAHFTSGGSEANLTSVLVALARTFPEVVHGGVRAIAKAPILFTSAEAHHSFEKTAQHSGLGRDALRIIECDERDRMRADALEAAIVASKEAGERPFFVAATAGTTSTGAIDPLVDIADICRRHELWLHVDAAWGGAAMLSDKLRRHLAGIERADSITCDAHKWISAPMGAGMFFTRHRDAIRAAFAIDTPYVPKNAAQEPDNYASSLQWSRRFIGLKVFMALAELGEEGMARQIEHHAEVAEYLREQLVAHGWIVTSDSPLAMVTFRHPTADASAIVHEVVARGNAWVSPLARAGHMPEIRACVTNFATSRDDIDILVNELDRAVVQSRQGS